MKTKTKTLPFTPKTKPKPKVPKQLTDAEILAKIRKVNHSNNSYPQLVEMAGCCGMMVLVGLKPNTPTQQAAWLLKCFENQENFGTDEHVEDEQIGGIGMIILTDVVGRGHWEATKVVATKNGGQGLVVKNPNSGNDITHWSVTKDMIPEIYRYGLKK